MVDRGGKDPLRILRKRLLFASTKVPSRGATTADYNMEKLSIDLIEARNRESRKLLERLRHNGAESDDVHIEKSYIHI